MKKRKMLIIALLFICAGGSMLFVTLFNLNLEKKFRAEGAVTSAAVVKHYTTRTSGQREFMLRLAYQSKSGAAFEIDEKVKEEFWNQTHEGDKIAVRYLISSPNTAEILSELKNRLSPSIQFVISSILIAAGFVIFIFRLKA